MKTEQVQVTDEDVRAALRQQAEDMPRVKLPKAGTTKAFARGRMGSAQRGRLHTMRLLRRNRARWLNNEFDQGEMDAVRTMMERYAQMFQKSEPTTMQKVWKKLKFWERS